jgi:hypothetical protein
MRRTNFALPFAALAILLSAAACSADAGGSSGLKQQICTESDLGGSYIEKTSGGITIQNLADLSSDTSARAKQLKAAGMHDGRFAYWVHTVPKPPFDPPLEVVCQALEFGSPAQAQAFVRGLKPTPDDLASTGMVWLAKGHRTVEEIQLSRAGTQPGTPSAAGPRAFKITASGDEVQFTIFASVVADGRYVRTVYVGKEGNAAGLTYDDAGKVEGAVQQRVDR